MDIKTRMFYCSLSEFIKENPEIAKDISLNNTSHYLNNKR